MLCRVEMPANEQIFGRFYRHKLTAGRSLLAALLAPALLGLLGCGMLLSISMTPLIPAALAGVICLWYVYSLFVKPHVIFSKKSGAALVTEVTIFTDNGFTRSARSEEGGAPDNTSMQYTTLVRAVETSKDFYLFTSPAQAFLVDKAYFTKGTPAELRATLRQRLGDKFKTGVKGGR